MWCLVPGLLVPGAGALLVPGWGLLLVGGLLVLDWGLLLGGEAPPPVLISGREVGLEHSSSSGIWCCWNMVLAFFSCGLASGSYLLSGEKIGQVQQYPLREKDL